MRKALDIFLTLNLLAVTCYVAYLWYEGALVIVLREESPVQAAVDQSVYTIFAGTMKEEVNRQLGEPTEGYKPAMLMAVFPGLVATDFDNVEASIGKYVIEQGEIVHRNEPGALIHSAAGAIHRRGFDRLLDNVAARLQIDLWKNGTITDVMAAVSR